MNDTEKKDRGELSVSEITTEVLPAIDASKVGCLIVFCAPYSGGFIPLEHAEDVFIGTDPMKCGLIVNGTGISRRHCYLSYNAMCGTYLLMDLSTNGTYLLTDASANGSGGSAVQRLPKNHLMELEPGTEFYLSEPENRFRVG